MQSIVLVATMLLLMLLLVAAVVVVVVVASTKSGNYSTVITLAKNNALRWGACYFTNPKPDAENFMMLTILMNFFFILRNYNSSHSWGSPEFMGYK